MLPGDLYLIDAALLCGIDRVRHDPAGSRMVALPRTEWLRCGRQFHRPAPEFGPSSNVAWKADVPLGRSSPVVFGAHLYVTVSEGDRLITLCYNMADGK